MMGFILFIITLGVLWYFILAFFKPLTKVQKNTETLRENLQPVSILICARNEAINLSKNLDSILTQNYPNFEVVVVNHNSTDETQTVLETAQKNYPNLKIVHLLHDASEDFSGKRYAIFEGLKQTAHHWILHTDADCFATSLDWITNMTSSIKPNTQAVLGYAPYLKENSFLNQFIEYETSLTGLLYTSFALQQKAYMGVGRNLLVHKNVYSKHYWNSFKHLPSGDDDLLINSISDTSSIEICIQPNTFMYSAAPTSWHTWFYQKLRHLSVGKYYKKTDLQMLSLFYGSFIFPVFLGIWHSLDSSISIYYKGFEILVLCVSIYIVFSFQQKVFGLKNNRGFNFWGSYVFFVIYLIFMPIIGLFYKPTSWKQT